MIEFAFNQHLRESNYFPRPHDILQIIRIRRESLHTGNYVPIDKNKTAEEQATAEWQELSKQARAMWAKIAGKSV